MEYITKKGTKIEYSVSGTNCHVVNSAEVHDDEDKRDFIAFLLEFDNRFQVRSPESYEREWKAHNILYKRNFKVESTKATDLNYNEYWWRRVGYFFICLFFKE